MMIAELQKTPLHDWHVAHGGRMVDFAGWSMPVQYTSIAAEHQATRNAVGVFDISHMGRLVVGRRDASRFLDAMVTRRVTDMQIGQIRYSLVCNEGGGILDDVLVYYASASAPRGMIVVVNASNRTKIVSWLECAMQNGPRSGMDARLQDYTMDSAMIAVHWPRAAELLTPIVEISGTSSVTSLKGLRYYHCSRASIETEDILVSRTGYTGEDGFEIICGNDDATVIWERIVGTAEAVGGKVCGLAARDTLRLEAAMPLYGHELSETINPYQAGLNFAVNLDGREFVGREALKKFATDTTQPVRVGLQLEGRRVPRQGCAVLQGQEQVGEVTSGTFSPTFQRPIAMAYVRPSAQAVGTRLAVDIRGNEHAATVVPLPFYERGKKV